MESESNISTQPYSTAVFTAAQFAAALGMKRQSVRWHFRNAAPARQLYINGAMADAWPISALPEEVRSRGEQIARRNGYRDLAHMLANPPRRYQPAIPAAELHPDCWDYAAKLQRAQEYYLQNLGSTLLTPAELLQHALEDYARAFGHPVTERHCRDLLNRTIERAGAAKEWGRLEIFLPDKLKRKCDQPAQVADIDYSELLEGFKNKAEPTSAEKQELWREAIQLFQERVEQTGESRKEKRALLAFLWRNARFLAESFNALRVNFDRKLKNPEAIIDRREQRRGTTVAQPIPASDIDLLVGHSAWGCGGRVKQAVRELARAGGNSGLTEATLQLIRPSLENPNYVNPRIYRPVMKDVRLVAPYILGKKAIDDSTASLRRVYRNLRPMTAVTADDYTFPVYSWIRNWTGPGILLTRGQCILFIDCRTLKIVGRSLQPDRNYNSLVIRSTDNKVMRKWGVPKVKLFERGIWEKSKVIKNAAPLGWELAHSPKEHNFGWQQLGVKIIHATRARTKPAELVGGLLQNLMEREIGYCGRDERHDCPEVTKRNKLAVEAGRVSPEGLFMSFDEWVIELDRLIDQYNSTPQNGFILEGASPDQAFERLWPHDDPPTPFEGRHWHLLAHYVSRRRVTSEGIQFTIGKEKFVYRDENTAKLQTDEVLAWFDPECPDLLGVTDLKQRNPVLVQRRQDVDFLATLDPESAAAALYRSEVAKVAAHSSYARARVKALKGTFEPTFRKPVVSPQIANTGEVFQKGRERHAAEKAATERRANTIRRKARNTGVPASMLANDEGTRQALEEFEAAQRELHAAQQSNEESETNK